MAVKKWEPTRDTLHFLDDRVRIQHVDGRERVVRLEPRSVADFYDETVARLQELVIEGPSYSRRSPSCRLRLGPVKGFFQSLVDVHRVMCGFRSRFTGRASPVHFF